ncbi:hypothetical protein [Sphingomonas psychrolutea]|uniref:Transposase n=1 Tax=Sphingomonas psychrolutea TaxID=1259676 RepID=A0ABQ1G650_9SPHN|nr:hypothetical protein [Sphingomonas psychrolutea]GGA37511.1 hypothetical protein GCM10011395_04770 [Sphingomonas psychrolutea]
MKQEVITVGLDLAKKVFQGHAIGSEVAFLARRKLQRSEVIGIFVDLPTCLVGMVSGASPHHCARGLVMLRYKVRPEIRRPAPEADRDPRQPTGRIC